jgi:ABC-type glycerol-3-phosphate transport system substrate-binding protein
MQRVIGLALAVLVATSFAVAAQARPAATASQHGDWNHRSADVTFTKWVTSLPADPSTLAGVSMAGVVGGDVGPGVYQGKVIRDDTTSKPGFWLGQALYGFYGSEHSFVAYNFITENDTVSPATATIRGTVISGWMKGARVTGGYTALDPCPIATPGNVFGTLCFQGTLHLQRGGS